MRTAEQLPAARRETAATSGDASAWPITGSGVRAAVTKTTPVHCFGSAPERARDLRADHAGCRAQVRRERLGERQGAVEAEPDINRMFEGPDPVEEAALRLFPHPLDTAHTPLLAGLPELGDGLDAERGMKCPDLVEPEAGDPAEGERSRRHALAKGVQRRGAARPVQLSDHGRDPAADAREAR